MVCPKVQIFNMALYCKLEMALLCFLYVIAVKKVFLSLIQYNISVGYLPTEIKDFIVDHATSKGRPIINFAVLYLMVKALVCGHRIVQIETSK